MGCCRIIPVLILIYIEGYQYSILQTALIGGIQPMMLMLQDHIFATSLVEDNIKRITKLAKLSEKIYAH